MNYKKNKLNDNENDDDDDDIIMKERRNNLMKNYGYTLQFTTKDVHFLEQLPYTIYVPSYNTIIVHAGLVPNIPLENQQPLDMYKMRDVIEIHHEDKDNDNNDNKNNEQGKKISYQYQTVYKKKNENAINTTYHPWASKWKGPYHVYFGHDAKRGLQRYKYATGLDSGCCYGNELTGIVLPTLDIVSINAYEVYEQPGNIKYF